MFDISTYTSSYYPASSDFGKHIVRYGYTDQNPFKVGDRVRRVASSHCGMEVGDFGTVTALCGTEVVLEEYGDTRHLARNLKLFTEDKQKNMTKFKVGDRVQNIQTLTFDSPNAGKCGTVRSITPGLGGDIYHIDYDDGGIGQGEWKYYKLVNNTSIMKKLTNFIKKAVDADTQELLKAGFINGDLAPTYEGEAALKEITWFANHEALVKLAKEKNAEAEAAEKKS